LRDIVGPFRHGGFLSSNAYCTNLQQHAIHLAAVTTLFLAKRGSGVDSVILKLFDDNLLADDLTK
jgi:hypothetical protein